MDSQILADLKASITKGKNAEVLEQLSSMNLPGELDNKVNQLKARIRRIQDDNLAGVLSAEDNTRFKNEISRDLLSLISDLERHNSGDTIPEETSPKKSFNRTKDQVIRFAIYFAAIIALAWGYSFLQDTLEYGKLETGLIAIIPLFLVFLTDTIPGWLKYRRKKQLIDKAINGTIPPPGYFRLAPYEAKDLDSFQRADGMHETVLDWLKTNKSSILYLSGESGTGKSSLLNGFVIPKLQTADQPFNVLTVRGYNDPIRVLEKKLVSEKLISEGAESLPIREILEQAMSQQSNKNQRLLIVFDQFEEFLILHNEEERMEFEAFLTSLKENPIEGLSVLLVFRTDYLGELLKLNLPELEPNKNWRIVSSFGIKAAKKFLADSGLKIGDVILKDIIKEAESLEGKEGLIRPIILNMYGMILTNYSGELPKNVAPDALLKNFLEESINLKNYRENARLIIRNMITHKGTKQPTSLASLETETGIESHALKGFMLELAPKGIVRRIDAVNQVWEISHDFLAQLLHRTVYTWRLPRFTKQMKWVISTMIVIWVGIVFYILPYWKSQKTKKIIKALSNSGFIINIDKDPFQNEIQYSVSLDEIDNIELDTILPLLSELKPTSISITVNPKLTNLNRLHKLSSLKTLFLADYSDGYDDLINLNGLIGLESLQSLMISGFDSLINLKGIAGLKSLEILFIMENENLSNLNGLEDLSSLRSLSLSENINLGNIDGLKGLKSLKTLWISNSPMLDNVKGLAILDSLESLSLYYNNLYELDGLERLSSLKSLTIVGNPELKYISSLEKLNSLKELILNGNTLISLDGLSGLDSLEKLDLTSNKVNNLDGLAGLNKLKELYLGDNDLNNLSGLKGLNDLHTLDLQNNENLSNLELLKELTSLKKLNIQNSSIKPDEIVIIEELRERGVEVIH